MNAVLRLKRCRRPHGKAWLSTEVPSQAYVFSFEGGAYVTPWTSHDVLLHGPAGSSVTLLPPCFEQDVTHELSPAGAYTTVRTHECISIFELDLHAERMGESNLDL
jgi:hypothetical protein